MQALLSLWDAGKHQQALDMLIPIMLRCSPGSTEEGIRRGLRFHADGRLQFWNLYGCALTALPEEFGTVRTTGDLRLDGNQIASLPESFGHITVGGHLHLYGNQIASLPESFGRIAVGGDLYLKCNGRDMGPAMAKAVALCYPNVKGKVFK